MEGKCSVLMVVVVATMGHIHQTSYNCTVISLIKISDASITGGLLLEGEG